MKIEKTGKPRTISFADSVEVLCTEIYSLCKFADLNKNRDEFPCRNFLRNLYSQSTRIEEMLDIYGARRNSEWFQFRELIAAQKLFSYVCYNILHVHKAAPAYKLMDIKDNLAADTRQCIEVLKNTILNLCSEILKLGPGDKDNIDINIMNCSEDRLTEVLNPDKKLKEISDPAKTAIYLATKVLNYSEDTEVLDILRERTKSNFAECMSFNVSEEKLRIVESRFHNLQAKYDTYISETDLETSDKNLPFLRSHVSIIFHLLESATGISHFYERHIMNPYQGTGFPFNDQLILDLLFAYLLHYANLYLSGTREICRKIIRSYSETKEITLNIPKYRGFHVRPSTLIAKIAAHFGSPLSMVLDGNEYDASQPLELFRANEDINACKRRFLGEKAEKMKRFNKAIPRKKACEELTGMLFDMSRKKTIILYDHSIDCSEVDYPADDTLGSAFMSVCKHYLATGKLDINSDIKVIFKGDSRAISDLENLAGHGYGEDIHGNNIMLPQELSYLRN